jgi:hypothetical protein
MLDVPLRIEASLAYQERRGRRTRAGLRFVGLGEAEQQALLLAVFADARTWARAHDGEARRFGTAVFAFVRAFAGYLLPGQPARRRHPRRRGFRAVRARLEGREARAWLRDRSPRGLGLLLRGAAPASDARWRITSAQDGDRWGRTVHVRRAWRWFWSVGIELVGDAEVGVADAEKGADALVAVD